MRLFYARTEEDLNKRRTSNTGIYLNTSNEFLQETSVRTKLISNKCLRETFR